MLVDLGGIQLGDLHTLQTVANSVMDTPQGIGIAQEVERTLEGTHV